MAGSTYPFTWSEGVRPLRGDLHAMIALPALTFEELGRGRDPQLAALEAGQPVTFTTAQLISFYPHGQASHPSLPPDLTVADAWTLVNDDELTPSS